MFCIGLAAAEKFSIRGGGLPREEFEGSGKVALVEEFSALGDES
jgi:hypothetical protein